jgi:hypothetical protein
MDSFNLSTKDPKEAILDMLRYFVSEELPFSPNMDTIQFMRARRLSGHQLHDVTFRDSKGQLESFCFLLCQWSNGSWHVAEYAGGVSNGASSHAPSSAKTDRPWLSLGGSTSFLEETGLPGGVEAMQEAWKIFNALMASGDREKLGTFYQMLAEQLRSVPEEEKAQAVKQFLQAFQQTIPSWQATEEEQLGPFQHFFAYGTVIDNGYDIARVRLISTNGYVFEDTLEDGLLLFASHQKVIRPLQAELYNRAGELVCRQRVLQPFAFPPNTSLGGMFRNKP